MTPNRRLPLRRCALALLLGVALSAAPASGDPPPWAPAHGYRAAHPDHEYSRHHRDEDRRARGDDEDSRDWRDDDGRGRQHYHQRPAHLPWSDAHGPSPYIRQGHCNRAAVGTVVGGALGGVLGSQVGKGDGRTAATIAGTLAGMLLGHSIGRSMDQADQYCTGQALEYTPDGQSVQWHNPDTDERYRVTPTRTYQNQDGRYCRQYVTEGDIAGKVQQIHGAACRQPDGSWHLAGR
ncbi:MAG: RT0821/Lpp0805 family surface protein [Gammaproteobacteria bacterium]